MTALTLPGTIEGLLRECSPVRVTPPPEIDVEPFDGVIGELLDGAARLWMPAEAWDYEGDMTNEEREVWHFVWLTLRLDSATGRAHAAWWLPSIGPWLESAWRASIGTRGEICDCYSLARTGLSMTDEQVDRLRRVVLHVAGLAE